MSHLYYEYRTALPFEETYEEWLWRQRRAFPLGFWSLSKHQIVRQGLRFYVWQRNRLVGSSRSYFGALRLAQESGAA